MADILGTAKAAGTFQTLVAAVEAAGLEDALSGPGPLTVFAPTDEAFGKLPAGTVEGLLRDLPQLRTILLYHIVEGRKPAAEVVSTSSLPTMQGRSVAVKAKNGPSVDSARIVRTDIEADNGIIHAIDSVLMPKTPRQ